MNRQPNSSVILHVTRVLQEMELQNDKERLEKIDTIQKIHRRPKKQIQASNKKDDFDKKMDKIKDLDQHRLTWPDLYQRLQVDDNTIKLGLTTDEAEKRHHEQGDNTLTQTEKDPWYVKLLREFIAPFSILLEIGAILSFIAFAFTSTDPSNMYLGIALLVVVIISALVTFAQNAKSDSIMEGFKNFIPPMCTAIRDGKPQIVAAIKLVRGDIIEVKEGERIPADIRIISSNEMKVDNSSLTGESDPLLRTDKCDQPEKILETKNVAFFGTLCKYGKGRGIVFNIGDDTIIGQIAGLADSADSGITPLRKELNRFVVIITIISFLFAVVFIALGFILGYSVVNNFVFAIGILVANVPEGILPTITITLALAAKRLSYKKVLVKNLESVETLGSTSCICSDKTGTLTQNKMTVENLWYNLNIKKGESLEVKGKNYSFQYDLKDPHFQALHRCAILNSSAVFSDSMPEKEMDRLDNIKAKHPDKYDAELLKAKKKWVEDLSKMPYYERQTIGDASETALIKFFQPLRDIVDMRVAFPTAVQFDNTPAIVPFNSSYKYALIMKETPEDPEYSYDVYIKGAPEQMWVRCKYIHGNNQRIPIDEEINKNFEEANKVFAKQGERVLGFARYRLKRSEYGKNSQFNLKDPFNLPFPPEFEFLGLISLIDPPRESVPDAIQKCKTAGIKIIMVTGDQQLTAASIATKIGIFETKTSVEIAEEEGIPYEEAVEKATAIVINGDMLTKAAAEDEGLPESEKGKKLEKWLKKPQIVFARTSPAQKLYIVKGCQRLGYVVAVTGDGVNDSPAIKQADIGIAMGITGSDVAKDAADMILLNDDFSSIVVGVEEGRRIFDNIKKAIIYIMSSNIPELLPVLIFIIFGIPMPLTTILMLAISVGTDIFPAISFAYELPEIDIMTRMPRHPYEHMVTMRMVFWVYFQMGLVQTAAGFMCYFIIMNQFGFAPQVLLQIMNVVYFPHNKGDVYDPTAPYYGNTNVSCVKGTLTSNNIGDLSSLTATNLNGVQVDWLFTTMNTQDLRMGYLSFNGTCAVNNVVQSITYLPCSMFQISPVSTYPVCYTTEAVKYAQTAFFFAVVTTQFTNTLCCKTRKLSIGYQGLGNEFMTLGWAVEFALCLLFAYARPLNSILGTRDLTFYHFAMYGLAFSISMLVIDETRKYLIRNFPQKSKDKANWFERNILF